jgi:lysophospholipase L1-like esterase
VKANEVLWIGDSWIEIPGTQHTMVRDLARTSGALGQNEDYVDKAVSGSPITTIIQQYTAYQAGATKVKVLLMDGGGIDVMQQNKTQASVDGVVEKVKAHLTKVKADGTVQQIIYYTYPQLPASGPGQDVGPKLQPGLQAACEASAVPCHYLYLEPLFMGHPEYIGSDSLHPSEAGAKVIAQAVWDIMKKNCIAQ